jgi:membrane protein
MVAGPHDSKLIRGAKSVIATKIIPSARRWHELVRHEWWSILMAIGVRIGRDNVSLLAAGVAFYIFVAIPSGLAAIVSVYGLMFNPTQVESQINSMIGLLPTDVIQLLADFLKMLSAKPQSALGIRLIIGLLVAIWSAQSAASSMITALDAAYEQKDIRGYFRFQAAALVLSACSIVFALLSLVLFAVAPLALAWFPFTLSDHVQMAIAVFRWPALTLLTAVAIAGIYRFAPARYDSARPWGIWGVALTTFVWLGSSALFAIYVAKFASYDASYGSLGGVVVLLLWLYIAVFIVLLGAELNAEIESRMETENKVADAPQPAIKPPPKDAAQDAPKNALKDALKDSGSSPRRVRGSNRRSF